MSSIAFATNDLEDAVFSLRMVHECLARVRDESHYWKWVIIALHNSLQGFMVSALCHSNSFPVIESAQPKTIKCPACSQEIECPDRRAWGSLQEWEKFLTGPNDSDLNPPPKPRRLVPFMTLYRRIKTPCYMELFGGSKPFTPQRDQGGSVKAIHGLRNTFVHFTPKFWLAPGLAFVPIVKDVTEVVSFLAFESGNIIWVDLDNLRLETEGLVNNIYAITSELDRFYLAQSKTKRSPNPEVEERLATIQQSVDWSVEEQ